MKRCMRCLGLIAAFGVALCPPLLARDLGVHGPMWPILEIDLRQLIIESAARADWDSVDEQMRSSAKHYLSRLPKRSVSTAARTATRWIDPSFTLGEDLRAPVRDAQGEWQWSVLHAKGTRFNPLSVQRPDSALLFFDGTARDQVAFATAVSKAHPARVMLIEASGIDPRALAKSLDVPVFNGSNPMFARFDIRATPALLCAGEGAQALSLGLTEFARPFPVTHAERVCPVLRSTAKGVSP